LNVEFIRKLNIGTAGGWLERWVRCVFCLECTPDVSVMKYSQKENRWCEKGDKRAYTDYEAKTWINWRGRPRLLKYGERKENRESGKDTISRKKKSPARPLAPREKRKCQK
jgi:hypothetical protein